MNTNAAPDRMRWYLLPALAIYLAGLTAYALWSDTRTKRLILEDIDQRILVAARALPYILPPDFHDRAVAPEAIGPEEELALRSAVTGFAADSGFVYVYTLVSWQDGFYFSAPTVTEEEALERESWYFYPYEDIPEEFVKALNGTDPVYVSYSDQWGTFRSVALPRSSPDGRPYLACADLDIGHVQDLVHQNTLVTVGTTFFFIALTLPIIIAFRAMWMGHYSRLTAANHELRQAQNRQKQLLTNLEEEREKLSDSQRSYRQLVDHVASAIIRLDSHCRVTFFNEYAQTLFELKEEAVLGRDFAATILENAGLQGRDMAGALTSLLEGDQTTAQYETRHKLLRGKVGWVHWSCRAVADQDSDDASILCVGQDVTIRKRLEADLVRALDEAQAASRAKGIFLANMSHEIRTPLNALLGYTQLLARNEDLTENQKEQIAIIESSGNHLLTLINDILEMSRIEAGKVPIVPTDFEFRPLMNEIGAMFRAAARARGLELDIGVADDIPVAMHADPTRIRQVVINLVGNALKYTVSGGVSVRSEFATQTRSQGPGLVTITVRDTGPGIPEGSLNRAMEAFERISDHECCPIG
ncbi:MAG: PAS domain S-box protein, partial [Deltaproteobacteria bacterium]|nr:PAS domain S-box protein [Deltaproteobacteria bacterium]